MTVKNKELSAAAEFYFRQKRVSYIGLLLYFPMVACLIFLELEYWHPRYIVGALVTIGIPSVLLVIINLKKWTFICPRCGNRFFGNTYFYIFRLGKSCVDCGLTEDDLKNYLKD